MIYIFFQSQNFSLKIKDTKSYNIIHDNIYIFFFDHKTYELEELVLANR